MGYFTYLVYILELYLVYSALIMDFHNLIYFYNHHLETLKRTLYFIAPRFLAKHR